MKHLLIAFTLITFLFIACQKEIPAYPFIATSVGTLGTTSDSCTGAIISGSYKKGTALVANTNTVSVSVNVTTIGTYAIYTDTVKGIYFGKIDSFSTTGNQTVILKGVGIPTDTGLIKFTVKYGTSTCKFFIRVDTGSTVIVTPPLNSDYFPMTAGSYWVTNVYDYGATGNITWQGKDSTKSTGITKLINGISYYVFVDNVVGSSGTDTSYYRKSNGLYFISDFEYGISPNYPDAILLKDNVPVGSSWSMTAILNISVPDSNIYNCKILEKNTSVSVNGMQFPDVIKVVLVRLETRYPGKYEPQEIWFAKGIGPIYSSVKDNNGKLISESTISSYKIF